MICGAARRGYAVGGGRVGPLRIAWIDEHLVAVDKPPGLLVHPVTHTPGPAAVDLLSDQLGERVRLAHRLDAPTSGVLLFARTDGALATVSRAFAAREVKKQYVAVVDGHLDGTRDVDAPIGRAPAGGWCVSPEGRSAWTRVVAVERAAGRTRVSLHPETGRTHQLRLHCAHLARPIVGDTRYGGSPAARLHLHAETLGFWHPTGSGWVEVRCPAPAGFDWAVTDGCAPSPDAR